MKKKTADKLIKIILEDFDFEQIHAFMKGADWRWYNPKIDGEIPSVKDLEKEAKMLLRYVCYNGKKHAWAYSGGLEAVRRGDEAELRFLLTSA